eukprot:gene11149-biopygen1996
MLEHFRVLVECNERTDGRTHAQTEDKPAQRDPLHAAGSHPALRRSAPSLQYFLYALMVLIRLINLWTSMKRASCLTKGDSPSNRVHYVSNEEKLLAGGKWLEGWAGRSLAFK